MTIATGILVIGGISFSASQSVEFWSTVDPEEGSCVLNDYPRKMSDGPTVNQVSGQLVACMDNYCEIYQEGRWQHLANTTKNRKYHSSVSTEDAVLLIGGTGSSNSTELIPMNGSSTQPGPFSVRHGPSHCTIQISADFIVVTGGEGTNDYVTQYQLTNGDQTDLASMQRPRFGHACGFFKDETGQKVGRTLRTFLMYRYKEKYDVDSDCCAMIRFCS